LRAFGLNLVLFISNSKFAKFGLYSGKLTSYLGNYLRAYSFIPSVNIVNTVN